MHALELVHVARVPGVREWRDGHGDLVKQLNDGVSGLSNAGRATSSGTKGDEYRKRGETRRHATRRNATSTFNFDSDSDSP
jgi:hypothetical protein